MPEHSVELPEILPLLARGKHRSPRKGACFMELASFLAGERWSDRPACTHPLLAEVARLVNDRTSDAARPQLAGLIPQVIGLRGDDPRIDARIALRCVAAALPIAPAARQHALAVAVLVCDRVLADLDGRAPEQLEELSRTALEQAPDAARWATEFASGSPLSMRTFRRNAAPSAIQCAVEAVAGAAVTDPDAQLRELLTAAVEECRWLVAPGTPPRPVAAPEWVAACELVGVHSPR